MKISVHYSLSGVALILFALMFFFGFFLGHRRDKVYTLSGTFKKYAIKMVGRDHREEEAHFKIYEYPNEFILSSSEWKSFDEEAFEKVATEGHSIKIRMERDDKVSLKDGADISILQISDDNRSYINEKAYWKSRDTNAYGALFLALLFGGIGVYQFVTIEKKFKSS